ncbi:MAG: HAMP domain-containing histidine kinase [Chloroflexi bacterium]|nr:HAMP domain-containing histidine kinase [Chloroflexota bacterium]
MMQIHSIRWRLTLSYAAIACVAALALGTVLLEILRGYYAERERAYLTSNARSFQVLLSSAIAEDVPISTLKPQLDNLAFFSKVRIRVLDDQGQQLIDTGIPANPYIITFFYADSEQAPGALQVQSIRLNPADNMEVIGDSVRVAASGGGVWQVGMAQDEVQPSHDFIPFDEAVPEVSSGCLTEGVAAAGGGGALISGGPSPRGDVMVNAVSALPISSTLYGFSLGDTANNNTVDLDMMYRSKQHIKSTIFDADHNPLGVIILSDGPAYGSEIVRSVARGWALAGGVAILLAAAAGWLVSRQISKPLLALTDVTTRMTAGDLSTRANIDQQDELGILAVSFNAMADRIQDIIITLQRFVADAAHELHTPLTALRTNLELAKNEHPSTAIRRAHEQVIRLEKLTDNLLALSRIEAHYGTEQAALVDLSHLIRAASELYASRAEQSGLDYVITLPDHIPPVFGRTDQLECVVSNLMDNAIKFTPAGGTVSLSLRRLDQTLELAIHDTGIGIPADDLPQLFERFRRGHNASHYPGSGLGLAITKAIVKAHGGSINAESSSAGTIMTVTLPLTEMPPI